MRATFGAGATYAQTSPTAKAPPAATMDRERRREGHGKHDQGLAESQPEYNNPNASYRGRVFNDSGIWKNRPATATSTMPPTTGTISTGDFNVDDQMSANAILGAALKDNDKKSIGTIEDAYVDKNAAIQVVIVSVGGYFGIGDKHVAVKWSDIKFGRDGNDVVLMTNWTKDALKAMPNYKYQRRAPAKRAGEARVVNDIGDTGLVLLVCPLTPVAFSE